MFDHRPTATSVPPDMGDKRGGARREPAPDAVGGLGNSQISRAQRADGRTSRAGQPAALRCFLVEDSPVIRQNLISTLEEMLPIEVVASAEDEQEAIQWLRRDGARCDLLIIDIFLKSGTGLEVLRRARGLCPDAKLVVLSNYATADMRQRCLELGADRIFDKSAEVDELLQYGEKLANARLN